MRKTIYISGTRADYGLMASTLKCLDASPDIDLSLCVTGMHLSPRYGYTVKEIEDAGLKICDRIPLHFDETSGSAMAKSIAKELDGMVDMLVREEPDIVMVLGDRGEMLAATLAAVHLNIPVVHIHGGERSGSVDESVRHAISKLAHYHFTATVEARDRLIRMGENPENIYITGAPGLDGIIDEVTVTRFELCADAGLDPNDPVALVVFHPVVQQAAESGLQVRTVIKGIARAGYQAVFLMPNSDAGSNLISEELENIDYPTPYIVYTHLPRHIFISWLAAVNAMVGNSSSGIIEAGSFGTPVVNIGNRQMGRARNLNVTDVPVDSDSIYNSLLRFSTGYRFDAANIYGDGHASKHILELLQKIPFNQELLNKINAY